jgi:hypothetical protein
VSEALPSLPTCPFPNHKTRLNGPLVAQIACAYNALLHECNQATASLALPAPNAAAPAFTAKMTNCTYKTHFKMPRRLFLLFHASFFFLLRIKRAPSVRASSTRPESLELQDPRAPSFMFPHRPPRGQQK